MDATATQRYRGVKWIYLRHDLQASIVAACAGRLSPRGWWRSVRGPKIEAVGSWRDPLPFALDAWRTLTAIGGRLLNRRRHSPSRGGSGQGEGVMGGSRGAAAAVAATPVFGGIVRALEAVDRDRPDVLPGADLPPRRRAGRRALPGAHQRDARRVRRAGRVASAGGSRSSRSTGVDGPRAGGPPIAATLDPADRSTTPIATSPRRPGPSSIAGGPRRPVRPDGVPGHGRRVLVGSAVRRAHPAPSRTEPLETDGRAAAAGDGRADRVAAFRTLRGRLKRLPHATGDGRGRSRRRPTSVIRSSGSSVLGWDELRRLAAEGVTLAPHSRVHPLLERIEPEELDDEIAGSRADLVREIGAAPAAFAYPSGSHSDVVAARVRRSGSGRHSRRSAGSTTSAGPIGIRLRRINVGGRSSPALIRAQALGWLAR